MAFDQFPYARLVIPSDKLPWGGRLFGQNADHPGFERVDLFDSTVNMLLAGRSIEIVPDPTAPSVASSHD